MKKVLGLVFLSGLAIVGCKQEMAETAKPAAEMGKATEKAVEKAAEAAAAKMEDTKALAAAGDADAIGVAECDDYVAAMKACLDKMPAAAKEASENAFKQSISAWKSAAATEAGKTGLTTACKTALDAVKSNPACQ